MPVETVFINNFGDTAEQFVMPAGWRSEYYEYLLKRIKKMVILLDIDNCISDDAWRIRFIKQDETDPDKKYDNYHLLAPFDRADNLEELVRSFHDHQYRYFVLTARPEKFRVPTEIWLKRKGLFNFNLIMRKDDDHSSSVDLKRKMVDEVMGFFQMEESLQPLEMEFFAQTVTLALDDRQEVVDMYKSLGFNAHQLKIHDASYEHTTNRDK